MPLRLIIALSIVTAALVTVAGTALGQVSQNSVTLTWSAPGDDGSSGTARQYDLRYSTSPITASNFGSATRWTSIPVPGSSGTTQSTTVTGLLANTTYYFAMKTADEVPNWSAISNVLSRATLGDVVRPARVTTLATASLSDTMVTLQWTAVGDDSLQGVANRYDLRFITGTLVSEFNWAMATQASGEPVPGTPGTVQTLRVTGLARQKSYYFALKVIDEVGNTSALSNSTTAIILDTMAPATTRDLVARP